MQLGEEVAALVALKPQASATPQGSRASAGGIRTLVAGPGRLARRTFRGAQTRTRQARQPRLQSAREAAGGYVLAH